MNFGTCEVGFSSAVLFLVYILQSVNRINGICEDPDNATDIKAALMEKIKNEYIADMTFFNIPAYVVDAKAKLKQENKLIDLLSSSRRHESRVYGQSKCKKLKKINAANLNQIDSASTCPWHVVLEYDTDRIPMTVTKAKCSCSSCIAVLTDPCSKKKGCTTKKKSVCEQVKTYMPVIRRVCVNNVFNYMVTIETVPVGCTCRMGTFDRKTKQETRKIPNLHK